MQRLFIVIPVYALVVIFLPRSPEFQALVDPLMRLHPDIAIVISLVAGVVAGGFIWLLRSVAQPWVARRPRVAEVIGSGFMGVVIAAIFDAIQRLSGSATNVVSLITLPIGFMIAEAVFLAIQWRLMRREED